MQGYRELGCDAAVCVGFALCLWAAGAIWDLGRERGHQEAEANRPEAAQARAWQQYLEAQEVAKEK